MGNNTIEVIFKIFKYLFTENPLCSSVTSLGHFLLLNGSAAFFSPALGADPMAFALAASPLLPHFKIFKF